MMDPDLLMLNVMMKESGILINNMMITTLKGTKENHYLITFFNFSL